MKIKRFLKWSFLLILVVLIGWVFIAYWTSTNDCDRKTALVNPMKAIRFCEYGSPDVLKFEDVEKPVPNDDQVLIKVRAASLNPADAIYTGRARIVTGLRKPKSTRFGIDYSGTVEAVGKNVTRFKRGDEVFGFTKGAAAEYVCVAEDRGRVLTPSNMS